MRRTGAIKVGRVDVSEPASISSGIAERYAAAVFEIAQENNALSELESSLEGLSAAFADSAELRDLITSPLISREEQGAAITAIAQKIGVQDVLVNVLGLMAQKRRLFVLPQLIAHLQAMLQLVSFETSLFWTRRIGETDLSLLGCKRWCAT